MHRVDQMGGEEAKVVLITCLSHCHKVKIMEYDLRNETGGEDKLVVLGIEDLREDSLWKKIKEHIWG